jgi:hypothetical protein
MNIEKRAYQKHWRETHKEYIKNYMKEYSSRYYLSNKDRLKPIRAKWEKDNKEVRSIISARHREANKERLNKNASTFRKKYPELVIARVRKHQKTTKGRLTMLRAGATRRGLTCSITIDQLEVLLKRNCTYCGDGKGYIGIDRIDNNKGYEIDNVCACCTLCNMMKKTLTLEQFLNHVKLISEFNK